MLAELEQVPVCGRLGNIRASYRYTGVGSYVTSMFMAHDTDILMIFSVQHKRQTKSLKGLMSWLHEH